MPSATATEIQEELQTASPEALPLFVRGYPAKILYAWLKLKEDPRLSMMDLSRYAGVNRQTLQKYWISDNWGDAQSAMLQKAVSHDIQGVEAQYVKKALALRARLADRAEDIVSALELVAQQMFDPNTGTIKEIVKGYTKLGDPIMGMPTLKDAKELATAFREAKRGIDELLGQDRRDRIEERALAAQAGSPSDPFDLDVDAFLRPAKGREARKALSINEESE